MPLDFKRLLYTDVGRIFISILLGLGIASLFRKVCKDKECIEFRGPIISEIDGRIFQFDNECYKFKERAKSHCDTKKKIVQILPPVSDMDDTTAAAVTANEKIKYMEKTTIDPSGTEVKPTGGLFDIGKTFNFLNGRSGAN